MRGVSRVDGFLDHGQWEVVSRQQRWRIADARAQHHRRRRLTAAVRADRYQSSDSAWAARNCKSSVKSLAEPSALFNKRRARSKNFVLVLVFVHAHVRHGAQAARRTCSNGAQPASDRLSWRRLVGGAFSGTSPEKLHEQAIHSCRERRTDIAPGRRRFNLGPARQPAVLTRRRLLHPWHRLLLFPRRCSGCSAS